ncbi:WhiB family transcriptional regulator [Actinocorallia longicatena]|uniref:4Fe-4S Wbl-type domain-containing protein n=1 Tax=Actinocorallia longicatena TaxID=111803 RepID=A0ABP6QKL6_9ACTN
MTLSMSERNLFDLPAGLAEKSGCRFDPELHTGPDLFETEPRAEREAREDAAKAVCEECPVWAGCLDYALRIRPTHGVWAGYTASELAKLGMAARLTAMVEVAR